MIVPFFAEDAARVAFGVVILVRAHRVDKGRQSAATQQQRNGDEIGKDAHGKDTFVGRGAGYFRRSAFRDTVMEELDIASAAIKGVAKPAMARGTAITL